MCDFRPPLAQYKKGTALTACSNICSHQSAWTLSRFRRCWFVPFLSCLAGLISNRCSFDAGSAVCSAGLKVLCIDIPIEILNTLLLSTMFNKNIIYKILISRSMPIIKSSATLIPIDKTYISLKF